MFEIERNTTVPKKENAFYRCHNVCPPWMFHGRKRCKVVVPRVVGPALVGDGAAAVGAGEPAADQNVPE